MDDSNLVGMMERLLIGAAPEQQIAIKNLVAKYHPSVNHTDNKLAPEIQTAFGELITFTSAFMAEAWLLGHAAWRAFVTYMPPMLVYRALDIPYELAALSSDPSQRRVEQSLDDALNGAIKLSQGPEPTAFTWPKDMPRVGETKFKNIEEQAVYELTCLAVAFAFFHELRHVMFAADKDAPDSLKDEELECDRFARSFLMTEVSRYATESSVDAAAVNQKRAMGIALGTFIILILTPVTLGTLSSTHPPATDRARAICLLAEVSESSFYWLYLSSLLLAYLRINEKLPAELVFKESPKKICERLFDLMA